ncbi:MAG: STAS/SEC14 domain-containing protein [Gammaproteobacteria bacterium]|nr:STAS/SEC14 domain-containing protein [Gammaproteobacteria bacterium]
MGYRINFLPEAGIIELAVEGELQPAGMRDSTNEALDLVESHNCFAVLVDCRRMHPAPLPSQVQKLPDLYASRGADRRLRIAVALSGSPAGKEVSKYYKMSAKKLDYIVQLFDDVEDALEWLESERPGGS